MTSDAKIGLLLGLVFIFIIAFIINGLPRFRSNTNNNELTTNMLNLQNGPMGIAAKERKVQGVFNQEQRVRERERVNEVQTSSDNREEIRFQVPLSGDDSVVESADDKARINEPSPVKPHFPKIYVVSEGDNLAVIAQKFYGPEKGNKKITVDRIFEANRKQLKSPDEIYVGQKLTMPLLKDKAESVFPKSLFEKVKSISRKLTSSDTPKTPSAKRNRQYVVREGDSLWQIAAEQLGDSTRYEEISELNTDILEDEDYLAVGTQLRMPAR